MTAKAAAVYDTHERESLPELVASALDGAALEVVLIHSPRAAGVVQRLLDTPLRRPQAQRLTMLGLSPACLTPLRSMGFAAASVAVQPTEDDLLALLDLL